ncbi:hypothetical protein [Arsenophonus sp. PmNCSU2021_1]|uniref:hypothetical protein n=1 Tax=Arsenophonus sp. PmNCSU2021_1 TaxID=3118989 RepID=UPI002FEF004E
MSGEITDRILYSYYLEQLFAIIAGRIDRFISGLLFISGLVIVLNGNPFFFGMSIVVLSAIQSTCQFGKKSGAAKKKAFDYLKLYTHESKFDDSELRKRLLELESTDEIIWPCLESIALLKTQIRLNIEPQFQEKLPWYQKLVYLTCS